MVTLTESMLHKLNIHKYWTVSPDFPFSKRKCKSQKKMGTCKSQNTKYEFRSQTMNDEADCRTAPATPCLLNNYTYI